MTVLASLLIKPLNHLVADAPWAGERLRRHAGAHLLIAAGGWRVNLLVGGDGLFHPASAGVADVEIALPDDFLAKMLVDRQSLMVSARLSGSAEIAETLAFVFRNLRWEAEGDLARLVGDIPARRLAQAGQALFASGRAAGDHLVGTLGACASDLSGPLAAAAEIAAFSDEVGALDAQLQRLERRLGRLGS